MKRFTFIIFLLLFPLSVHANADLRIGQHDIRFSSEELIAGDTVRIYATIYNDGNEDVSGYVTFFQGSVPVGDSQVISLLSGGNPEEVYIDFVVPSSFFNIRAEIRGTDPADIDTDNNTTITSVYEPVFDDDRDGVINSVDNCPTVSNESQIDSDQDGVGDMCDDDDDDDGLSDDIEDELGSDRTLVDTDGDGVNDQDDAYPTDPSKISLEVPVVKEQAPDTSISEDNTSTQLEDVFAEIVQNVANELQNDVSTSNTEDEPGSEEDGVEAATSYVNISPNALFSYERLNWNTYRFNVIGPELDRTPCEWSFGDGSKSSKTVVEHKYEQPGTYEVELVLTNLDGQSSAENIQISIPFFSIENRIVLTIVGGLFSLLVLGIGVMKIMVSKERKVIRKHFAAETISAERETIHDSDKKIVKITVKEDDND